MSDLLSQLDRDLSNCIVDWAFKVVNDDRLPVLVSHDKICYPPPNLDLIDKVSTLHPGILIDFENGYYLLDDGVHRIGKWQKRGIYESLFYVVTKEEYISGMVDALYVDTNARWGRIKLGEWCQVDLDKDLFERLYPPGCFSP